MSARRRACEAPSSSEGRPGSGDRRYRDLPPSEPERRWGVRKDFVGEFVQLMTSRYRSDGRNRCRATPLGSPRPCAIRELAGMQLARYNNKMKTRRRRRRKRGWRLDAAINMALLASVCFGACSSRQSVGHNAVEWAAPSKRTLIGESGLVGGRQQPLLLQPPAETCRTGSPTIPGNCIKVLTRTLRMRPPNSLAHFRPGGATAWLKLGRCAVTGRYYGVSTRM